MNPQPTGQGRSAPPARPGVLAHLPEYGMEAMGLAAIVFVAALATAFVTVRLGGIGPLRERVVEAVLVAATVLAMTYSPWGKRSGAHYNPAVTLTFLALGRVSRSDAVCYVAAQVMGALIGIVAAALIAGVALRGPPVFWIVTRPGADGTLVALAGEFTTAFLLMSTVLAVGGIPTLAPFTGIFAASLIFIFICVEAPLSGSSMNPARSLASALPAGVWSGFWIYVLAPPGGMLAAALVNRVIPGVPCTRCAKVQGSRHHRCIHCGHEPRGQAPMRVSGTEDSDSGSCRRGGR